MDNKKIIFQVTKTYMKKNRKRTLVTFLGILVMVVLMTAVFVGKDTVIDYMMSVASENSGSWHYQLYDVDQEQIKQIKSLDFVEKCELSKPLGYTEFAESGKPDTTPFLELKEYSNNLFELMNIKLKEGRYPNNPDEVIISARAISDGANIKIGDTIDINCFDRYVHANTDEEIKAATEAGKKELIIYFPQNYEIHPGDTKKAPEHYQYYSENNKIEMINKPNGINKSLTVVGIMEEPSFAGPGQGGYIAITGTDAIEDTDENLNVVLTTDVTTKEDIYGEIARILDNTKTTEERETAINEGNCYTTNTGEKIPVEKGKIVTNDLLLSFAASGQNGTLNFMITFIQIFFVVLITVASLVLIYNVFSMSYQERSKYLGMLSSIGATRRQKRWSVYYEVFSLLILSLPIGISLGLVVIKGGMALLAPHFSNIMQTITANIVLERSFDAEYRLVINPINIILVVVFSVVAVWISAWIPARKISKVGPVESIRGNETSKKIRKKGYKTYLGLMLKGKAEKLLAAASVGRNRRATKGIIRSITAFTTLTLITTYTAESVGAILDSEYNNDTMRPGQVYQGYKYVFNSDEYLSNDVYNSVREEIMTSDEISGYKEMEMLEIADWVPIDHFSDEYKKIAKEMIEKWFPNATPEKLQKYYEANGDYINPFTRPSTKILIMKDEDFAKVGKNVGIDLTNYESSENGPVLIYDTLKVTSQDYIFHKDGAESPDYMEYNLKNPLNAKLGEIINLSMSEYDEVAEENHRVNVPVIFAGYIKDTDIQEYYELKGDTRLLMIMPEKTRDIIKSKNPEVGEELYASYKYIFFSLNTDDSALIEKLSLIKDDGGRSCLDLADSLINATSFIEGFTKIANIVAVCFVILVALICFLNLYNSVLGRSLARHKEFAVLYSMGMTNKQKNKMLTIENIRLLVLAYIKSTLITLVFVISLYKLISLRFQGVQINIPVFVIIAIVLLSTVGLMVFSKVCYGHDGNKQIIDEIRRESV